jgi:hypothetical protein
LLGAGHAHRPLWQTRTLHPRGSGGKASRAGAIRSIDIHHTPRYLAGYEWRFNRRFDLPKNLERLARLAVIVAPKPQREIAAVRQRKAAGIPA